MHARDGPSSTVGSVISETLRLRGFRRSRGWTARSVEEREGRAKDASMKQQLGENCLERDGRSEQEESAGTLNMLGIEDYFLEREKRVSSLG